MVLLTVLYCTVLFWEYSRCPFLLLLLFCNNAYSQDGSTSDTSVESFDNDSKTKHRKKGASAKTKKSASNAVSNEFTKKSVNVILFLIILLLFAVY